MAASGKTKTKPRPEKRSLPPDKKPGLLPAGNTEGYTNYRARPPESVAASASGEEESSFAKSENAVYEDSDRERYMTLGDHLEELRMRLLWIIGILVVTSSITGIFIERIHSFLISPYKAVVAQLPSAQTSPGLILGSIYGSLEIYFKLAVMIGSLITLPLALTILWGFVTPAVSKKTARIGHSIVLASTLLFWIGVVFAYVYVFPLSLDMMLYTFLPEGVIAQTSLEKYYSFLFMIVLGSGITFQLPMVVILLGATGIIPIAFHRKIWKFVTIGILAFSGFFTPPDPFSLFALAIPLWALYAISVSTVWLIEKGKGRRLSTG
jgi:sec-independent protein translocase protein TatC